MTLPPAAGLPFTPLRWTLYERDELFGGFDAGAPVSFAQTRDFAIYRHFVAAGRHAPADPFTGMMQALHDHSITAAMQAARAGRKLVAIMGGHKMRRGSDPYRDVAVLARRLTAAGLLVCSGGGPGAMEATHLGAAFALRPESDLARAFTALGTQEVPALADLVAADGSVNGSLVAEAHAWFAPAYTLSMSVPQRGESLAIPTWHHGHEPTTPFATHVAKYFQNSIREDGLLAVAQQGIVYAEGKAGTVQEIFQDAAQNYYRSFAHFSPMVLLGTAYWTETLPVVAVLKKLLAAADFDRHVLVTDSVGEAAGFLERFAP